jgi:plastocyanin
MRRLALPAAGLCGLAVAVVPALAADREIKTSGSSFSPSDVTVAPGDSVTIKNSGGNHDLYWKDGAPGHPGPAPEVGDTGQWSSSRSFTADDVDKSFRFFCSVHSDDQGVGMDGIVRVSADDGGGGTTTGGTTTGGTTTGGTTTGGATPPPPPPPGGTTPSTTPAPSEADGTPPRVTGVRRSATRRGVEVRLTLDEPATITVRLFRGARRVARQTFVVDDGSVRLRLRRPLRPGRYRVRLALVDGAGNRATRSLSVRVK